MTSAYLWICARTVVLLTSDNPFQNNASSTPPFFTLLCVRCMTPQISAWQAVSELLRREKSC